MHLLRRTWAGLGRALRGITPTAWAALAGATWSIAALLIVQQRQNLLRRLHLSLEQQQLIDGFDSDLIAACAILTGIGVVFTVRHLHRQRAALASQAATITQLRAALDQATACDAARRESLSQLHLAIQQVGISVWEWDFASNMLRASEGADSISRLGVSQCSATEFAERFVHADDREALTAAWREHLSAGKDRMTHGYRLLHVDGSTRHVVFHAQIVRDSTGRAVRVRGVDCEVTFEVEARRELQQRAEQLQAAERRLERASRSSMEGHWEGDMTTGKMWMSSSLLALFGYDESMQFMDWKEYADTMVHPDDLKQYMRVLRDHLKHGTPYQMRVRFRRSDGSYQWTALQGALERDADGKPLRMTGASRNVHEQQLAELELQAVQARFERAIRGTRDGLFDLDLQTRKSWVAPRLWELLGHDPASMPREIDDPYRYVHPDDVVLLEAALRGHCEQGLPYDIEYRMRQRSGDWLWVRSRATAERSSAGVALRLSGSVHDISEARAAREALIRATQEAEAANRAKSTFLATMSHEIRTPMNGMIGMTDLLLDTPLERMQRDYVQTIRASSDSLLAIINDVLDFTKIEAGKLQVECIDMDLPKLIDEVAAIMALPATAKNVELIIDVHGTVPERVLGDPQRIRQCLSNLLGNAIKFTASGEVLVEISPRTTEAGAELIHFSVRDTGIGMSPAVAAKLFQPFVQADSSTTRQFGGTGLGLSIVKRLVEVMGGAVGLESEAGVGSTFWFALPLAATSEHTPPAALAAPAARILIVDDNASQRRVLTKQLSRIGYECEAVTSAEAALSTLRAAVLEQRAFAAALIDRHLEGMEGEQLGRAILAVAPLAELRMVLLTTVDAGNDDKRFAELGFTASLTKPLGAAKLGACLREVLAHPARGHHPSIAASAERSRPAAMCETYAAHVLLVEDNPVNQKVAQKFLERFGCQVLIAGNGAEAVARYQHQVFDLILMDMEMPVMDGTTATRRIREIEAATRRHTPIVALTANALYEQVDRCMQAGMDAFLSKPIELARLRDVLARYLNQAPCEPAAAQGAAR